VSEKHDSPEGQSAPLGQGVRHRALASAKLRPQNQSSWAEIGARMEKIVAKRSRE